MAASIEHMTELENLVSDYGRAMSLAAGLSSAQALLVLRLGDKRVRVGQLGGRFYVGTNVTYNVKCLVDRGLLSHESDPRDERVIWVGLTARGHKLRKDIVAAHEKFVAERAKLIERVAA